MGEVARIRDQVHRSFHGGPWHGPGLAELLAGLGAAEAAARPLPAAHAIWEIVLHLITWTAVVRGRLAGDEVDPVGDERDWPAPSRPDRRGWEAAVRRLAGEKAALEQALGTLEDADLLEKAPGSSVSRYELLVGLLQHDAYHAGQIGLLRKALGK